MQSGIESYVNYVGLTDAEVDVLREARPHIEPYADAFIDRFYAHLKAFEGTRTFLTQEDVVHRLLFAQRHYLLSLFDAKLDGLYLQKRREIGKTHFRIGLDFKWYVGAYALYLEYFNPVLEEIFSIDRDKAELVQSAFRKITLMDMSIVLEAYHVCDKAELASSKMQVTHQEKLATIGLLASGLAHEIGNPLASIQAVCDNQLRKEETGAPAEKFKRIRGQVVRIVEIVRKLVDYSRPSPDAWHRVNINDEVEAALGIARLSRSAKTVKVERNLSSDVPHIDALDGQMPQVFLNLFLNAIDAMKEQGGVLSVATRCVGNKVEVEVKDNGSGIAPVNLHRIFDPFFTTKDVGKGTGLGLHVSLGIVERHRGRIQAESSLGTGSTFTVELPVKQAAG